MCSCVEQRSRKLGTELGWTECQQLGGGEAVACHQGRPGGGDLNLLVGRRKVKQRPAGARRRGVWEIPLFQKSG